MHRFPIFTSSTSSTFPLCSHRPQCSNANYAQNLPSTVKTSCTVFSNLQEPSSITFNDDMSYFDSAFIPSDVLSIVNTGTVLSYRLHRHHIVIFIEGLATVLETVAKKTEFHMANQLVRFSTILTLISVFSAKGTEIFRNAER